MRDYRDDDVVSAREGLAILLAAEGDEIPEDVDAFDYWNSTDQEYWLRLADAALLFMEEMVGGEA